MKAYIIETNPGWYVMSGKDDTTNINKAKTFIDPVRARTFINHNISGMYANILPVEVTEATKKTVKLLPMEVIKDV